MPTIRLTGFPCLPERLSRKRDEFFSTRAGGPLGRWDLICLASPVRLKWASRLAIGWLHQPTCQLKSASWLTAATDWLLVVNPVYSQLRGVCFFLAPRGSKRPEMFVQKTPQPCSKRPGLFSFKLAQSSQHPGGRSLALLRYSWYVGSCR